MDMLAPALVPASETDPAARFADARPLWDPRRPAPRYDFGKAWHHFRKLVKNKEDTEQVFYIFEALPWTGLRSAIESFLASDKGKALMASEPYLPTLLDDHAALRKLPPGSLAHAYCDFMEREGLSAQGLVDEYDGFLAKRPDWKFADQAEWYFNRLRDTHDMLHVLTGFGRDALGEQCVLAFTYSQQPAPAHLFLGYAGGLEIKKQVKSKAPVLRAVREGQRLGKACPRIVEMSIRELLPMQVEDVRKLLNITPPSIYQQAHAEWRKIGVDPYDMLAAEKQAA